MLQLRAGSWGIGLGILEQYRKTVVVLLSNNEPRFAQRQIDRQVQPIWIFGQELEGCLIPCVLPSVSVFPIYSCQGDRVKQVSISECYKLPVLPLDCF